MAYGIDNIIQQTADAYRSNPGQLQQKYAAEKQLIDLLALEKIRSQQQAIANDMMAKVQVPPATVKDQVEGEVLNNERQMMAQRAQQGGQQLALNQQRAAQARGIPTQSAPNMNRMMQGGIVGYAEGGDVQQQDPMQAQLERFMQLQALYNARQAAGATEEELARIQADIDSYNIVNQGNYNIGVEADKARGQYGEAEGFARGGEIEGAPVGGDVVQRAMALEGITDPALASLILSLYQQETSGGRNVRTSPAGARGALQIMPATFDEMSRGELDMNSELDLARAGIRYAKESFEAAGGDPRLAAARYFGGPGGMRALARGEEGASDVLGKNVRDYAEDIVARMKEDRAEMRPSMPERETESAGIAQLMDEATRPEPMPARMPEPKMPTVPTMPLPVRSRRKEETGIASAADPAVRYLQGVGRSQDDAAERSAQGGLSYIKALADAEAAQKANALRYLQQAGKFQGMQRDTMGMLENVDPAANVKGYAAGDLVEADDELYTPTMSDVIAVEKAKRALLEASKPKETIREQGKIDVREGESYSQALRRRDQERASAKLAEMFPPREAEPSEMYAPNLADVAKVGDAQARLRKISELNAQLANEGRQFKRDAIQAEIDALNAPMREEVSAPTAVTTRGATQTRAEPTTPLEYLQQMGADQQVAGMMEDIYNPNRNPQTSEKPKSRYEELKQKYEQEYARSQRPDKLDTIATFLQGIGQSQGTNLGQALIGGGSALSNERTNRRMQEQKALENLLGLESKELQSSQDLEAALARAAASGLGKGSLTQNQALAEMQNARDYLISTGKEDEIRAKVEGESGTGDPAKVNAEVERLFNAEVTKEFNRRLTELQNLGSAPTVGSTVTSTQQAADKILGI